MHFMGKLFLEVVTPEKVVVSQEVDMVVAPGSEGEFGVLPGHVLFLSGIIPGEMRYNSGSETISLVVSTGFAEVSDDKVSILVDAAERGTDVDIDRAQQAAERARERMANGKSAEEIDYKRAEVALKRAIARIKVAEKFH
jgi:F-type H+-transporting ATPase subunit epsilon